MIGLSISYDRVLELSTDMGNSVCTRFESPLKLQYSPLRYLWERDFQLHIYEYACKLLAPWLFALDRTHYARWLPVNIRDMESADTELPAVAAELKTREERCI